MNIFFQDSALFLIDFLDIKCKVQIVPHVVVMMDVIPKSLQIKTSKFATIGKNGYSITVHHAHLYN